MTHDQSLTITEAFAMHLADEPHLMMAFYVLWILGSHIFLPVLAIVSLHMERRPAAMINVCIVWSLTGVLYSLLFHAHTLFPTRDLSTVCAMQSALVFAATAACAAAHTCLIYEARTKLQNVVDIKVNLGKNMLIRQIIVITLPYAVFVAFAIPGVVVSLEQYPSLPFDNPDSVSLRRLFYCSVTHGAYSMSAGVASALFLIPPTVIKGQMVYILCKNWTIFRKSANGLSDLRFALRMIILCTYVGICIALGFLSVLQPANPMPDMFFASSGVFVAVMFATGRDVWRTLGGLLRMCFCLAPRKDDDGPTPTMRPAAPSVSTTVSPV